MAAIPIALPATAQSAHWLVGTWSGQIIGFSGDNNRRLRVRSVGEDGSVAASWEGVTVEANFRNNELSLTTGAGSPVVLSQGSNGNLSGDFITNRGTGRRYSVVMAKS